MRRSRGLLACALAAGVLAGSVLAAPSAAADGSGSSVLSGRLIVQEAPQAAYLVVAAQLADPATGLPLAPGVSAYQVLPAPDVPAGDGVSVGDADVRDLAPYPVYSLNLDEAADDVREQIEDVPGRLGPVLVLLHAAWVDTPPPPGVDPPPTMIDNPRTVVAYVDGTLEEIDGQVRVLVPDAENLHLLVPLAEDLIPHPQLPCPDLENGCDRRYLDPADPDGCHWGLEDEWGCVPLLDETRTTNSFARNTGRGNFTTINFNSVRTATGGAMPEGGVVGLGLSLAPDGQPKYEPCGNAKDPYTGACMNPGRGGYVYSKNWFKGSSTNFGAGLFVGNASSRASCPYPCQHYWGQRVQRIDVELYAKNDTSGMTDVNYVRPRFAQLEKHFTAHANGGTYGPPLGQIRMQTIYDPGIARLAGIVTRNGLAAGAGDFEVRMFELGSSGRSTAGWPLATFATSKNNANGFYNTGALYADYYVISLLDFATGRCRRFSSRSVPAGGQRLDFNLDRADFGHPGTVAIPCK